MELIRNHFSDYDCSHFEYQNNKLNYKKIKNFIDVDVLKVVSTYIHDPQYVKFRYSNKNNLKDASTFHGDTYNFDTPNPMYVYTCLVYFDDAEIEVVPGTHIQKQPYNTKQIVKVKKGDVIIINANLFHRGINYHKSKQRKLLQVFDIYPSKIGIDKLTIVITQSSIISKITSEMLYYASFNQALTDLLDKIHYYFVSNNLHYKITLSDLSDYEKRGRYISYEPMKRLHYNENELMIDEQNINIICNHNIKTVYMNNNYLLLFVILVILLTVV